MVVYRGFEPQICSTGVGAKVRTRYMVILIESETFKVWLE